MDNVFEDLVDGNNTDELNNLQFELTTRDYVQRALAVAFTCIGLFANIVIIYIIARNVNMRSKTNIILLNFAINDALNLLSNLHTLASLVELMGFKIQDTAFFSSCIMLFLDIGFMFNAGVAVLVLMSNTLMKSKRIQLKWLVIGINMFVVLNFIVHVIHCHNELSPIMYMFCIGLLAFAVSVVVFKEINNCYKKWYQKDPLNPHTLFRLNIGRIYIGAWLSTFCIIMCVLPDTGLRFFMRTIAMHSLMSSMYILIYIVYADKNFLICFLNMIKCKGAGNYNADATITFAEESNDGNPGNNQGYPIRTHLQDATI